MAAAQQQQAAQAQDPYYLAAAAYQQHLAAGGGKGGPPPQQPGFPGMGAPGGMPGMDPQMGAWFFPNLQKLDQIQSKSVEIHGDGFLPISGPKFANNSLKLHAKLRRK